MEEYQSIVDEEEDNRRHEIHSSVDVVVMEMWGSRLIRANQEGRGL